MPHDKLSIVSDKGPNQSFRSFNLSVTTDLLAQGQDNHQGIRYVLLGRPDGYLEIPSGYRYNERNDFRCRLVVGF